MSAIKKHIKRIFYIINFILMSFWFFCFSPIIRIWTPRLQDTGDQKITFLTIFMILSFCGFLNAAAGSVFMIRKNYSWMLYIALNTISVCGAQLFFRSLHVVRHISLYISTIFHNLFFAGAIS